MRLAKTSGLLGLLALSIIASPPAAAQDSGFYIGGNLGRSKAKIDDPKIITGLAGNGFTVTKITDRDEDTGFKLFLGYQFNRYFSFEGGFFDLGKFGFTALTAPAGTLIGDIKLKGFNIDAVLNIPFTEKFSIFGRIGANNAEAKDAFAGTGVVVVANPNPSKREINLKYGGGLQYDFTKSFGMRAEAERYRINDAVGNKGDVDLFSVGLLIRFGRSTPAPAPRPVAAPEPAAAQPIPPPVAVLEPVALVVVPMPVKTEEYCTILDLTFEIDADKIEREDKEKLKVIGTFLTKYPDSTAVIEGHTDNVGAAEHNMRLSQARAQAVVTYLVDELKINRFRLTAVGYGNARPIADNSTEEGKRANRRINAVVACVKDIEGLTVAPARITMALEMEYDVNMAEVKPQYDGELRKVANFLKANPSVTATVEGHTGNLQGTQEKAMVLSQKRAENVVDYLVANHGIERSRLSAQGFGAGRHIAYNISLEGQQENRRVNIIINYPKKR